MLPTRDHFRAEDTHRLKVRGREEIFHANGNDKKTRVAIRRQNRPLDKGYTTNHIGIDTVRDQFKQQI